MKVLLYFTEDKDRRNYEAARIHRNLKLACDIAGIECSEDPAGDFDIAHFVSLEHEHVINKVKERNIPIVISTLMTEMDLDSILDRKNGYALAKPKAVKTLNKANLVLVPAYLSQITLKHSGVESPVQVLTCGVNTERFDKASALEKQVFSRYFSLDDDIRIVVNVAKYSLKNGLAEYIAAAKALPEVHFLWFGKDDGKLTKRHIRKLVKSAPRNMHFHDIVDEDVYKSVMLRADVYYCPAQGNVGIVPLLDALAARCQVIARDQAIALDLLINNQNCILQKANLNYDALLNALRAYFEGTRPSTVEKGYISVLAADTKVVARNLKVIYQSLTGKI